MNISVNSKPLFTKNKNIRVWQTNQISDNSSVIDFNGDNIGEILIVQKQSSDEKTIIDHLKVDRDGNQKFDAIAIPFQNLSKDGKTTVVSFDWLLDETGDGQFDAIGEDHNGDWNIERIINF